MNGTVQNNQLSFLWSFASSFSTPLIDGEGLSTEEDESLGERIEDTIIDTEFSDFLQGNLSYTSESTLFGGNICRGTGEEVDQPESPSLG